MVLVVGIWIVRVCVRHGLVTMPMCMRPTRRHGLIIRMLVMIVVFVRMIVLKHRVVVRVFMAFADMQPDAQPHQ